jgi:ubiquinone/menaquinone biosynthesis C-methylase UbiE
MSDDVRHNIAANIIKWDKKHQWRADGDEWTGQAGHGRWSKYFVAASKTCILVDLSPSCLDFCRQKFAAAPNIDYFLTTGTSLPHFCSDQIDFVFSYDSFVHIAPAVVRAYLIEIARVLRSRGKAILHHADIRDVADHSQDKHPGWRSAVNRHVVRSDAEAAGLNVTRQFVFWDERNRLGVPRFGDVISELNKP